MTSAVSGLRLNCEEREFPLADHFRTNYEEARNAFLEAAAYNVNVSLINSIPITACGPNEKSLNIDIAVLGKLWTAKKILIHISGTHGVEGFAGSAIQHDLLSSSPMLSEDTAIIILHGLNPFGMSYNRRVNEDNIDLNRNFTDDRQSTKLYDVIDGFVNPKGEFSGFDHEALHKFCLDHGGEAAGFSLFVKTLAEGQYHKPEGLFYGGMKEAEGPKKIFDWFERLFSDLGRNDLKDLRISVVDVHTGLGPEGEDTLLTMETPTDIMMQIFGEKMSESKRLATLGYRPKGVFIQCLGDHLQKITGCAQENLSKITQEFGTIEDKLVMIALVEENAHFFRAREKGEVYNPSGLGGQAMLRAFYPDKDSWRHKVVIKGQKLIENCFMLLENQEV